MAKNFNMMIGIGALFLIAVGVYYYKYYQSVAVIPTPGPIVKGVDPEQVKTCQNDCGIWNTTCTVACGLLDPADAAICLMGCGLTKKICDFTCTGKLGIRNASLFHVRLFDKNMKVIAQLGPVDPRRQDVDKEQFPITVLRCPGSGDYENTCTPEFVSTFVAPNDRNWTMKIDKPGCVIIWFAGGFYTTKGACVL